MITDVIYVAKNRMKFASEVWLLGDKIAAIIGIRVPLMVKTMTDRFTIYACVKIKEMRSIYVRIFAANMRLFFFPPLIIHYHKLCANVGKY